MYTPDEDKTRKELIDPALKKAGWDVDDPDLVGLEIPVDGTDPQAWATLKAQLNRVRERGDRYENVTLPSGISDYVLYRSNREILAVVEAKKTSRDPRLAQEQAESYIEQLAKRQSFRPFAFMTNGNETYFLEPTGAPRRLVAGFFSREELENRLYIQQHKLPLSSRPINTAITDRDYQQEAIRRVCETFEQQGKRKALLVMATGTGKTRTVMSLIDLFIQTNQARQILFVADRDALVQQAMTDGFLKFLPNEPCERIFIGKRNRSSRLYVSTLQTLNRDLQSFSPGFFDLIIFDEVHRSIFNHWSDAFQYFDAKMIGLTATPADFIDRNTFLSFECKKTSPTYQYSYQKAVRDGYLVDYTLYRAQTKFQRQGIKGVDLSDEERYALAKEGKDPDNIDFRGTDLEKRVSNKDTLRRQWEEIWNTCEKDESGQIPGKTIVFAITQKHALRLEEAFHEMYPQYPQMVSVITSASEHHGNLITRFKEEEYPRIAITVDLLETGIDVPEVVNLVFMKPVQSRIKLDQMIGRGTRNQAACRYLHRLPNRRKQGFLVIDFWENDFHKTASEELRQSLPISVALFQTRIKILEYYRTHESHNNDLHRLIVHLREQIAQIPLDAFTIKKFANELEQVRQELFWRHITTDKLDFLLLTIAPLLRYVPHVNVEITTFIHKVERLKLHGLEGQEALSLANSIAEDVSRLPNFVYEDARYRSLIDLCLTPKELALAWPAQFDQIIDTLAGQMHNKRDKVNPFITIDISDSIDEHGYVVLKGGSEQISIPQYRQLVDEHIQQMIAENPTMTAITQHKAVSDGEFIELERALHQKLGKGEIELTREHVRIAYEVQVGSLIEFVRKLLALDSIPDYNDIIHRQFAEHINGHTYNAQQKVFLCLIENTFMQRHHLHVADLYDAPFNSFGNNAVERLFTPKQIEDIMQLIASMTV